MKSRLTGVKPINYCYEDTPSLCVEVNLTGALIHAQIEQQKVRLSEIGKGRVSKICAMQHCLCMKVHLSHDIGPSCLHSAVATRTGNGVHKLLTFISEKVPHLIVG